MATYMHGAADEEQERLEIQARMFGGVGFLPPLAPDMRLLEVGCGTGAVARLVARQLTAGGVTGLDIQPRQIETARRIAGSSPNLSFLVGDIVELDVAAGSFDGAYCRYFLEHLEDPVAAVKAMARAVRPGGFVCAYEWENACYTSYPECPAVLEVWKAGWRLQDDLGGNGHMGRELLRVFVEAGFPDVQVSAHAFALGAANRKELAWYVASARTIIEQMRPELLARDLADAQTIARADEEYAALLAHPHAFCVEVSCCAVARIAEPRLD